MPNRSVFFVSDGTGIAAETFGNSILAQFDIRPHRVRLPFIDSVEKAVRAVERINEIGQAEGKPPVVFVTLVNPDVLDIIKSARGLVFDMFNSFVQPLEMAFGMKSNHRIGRFSDAAYSPQYHNRIDAINFSLLHDDGQSTQNLIDAEVILVGVSRCGKTPTSLYLAMQHGVRAANYPLIPDDFERMRLPDSLTGLRHKLFGLTIAPDRLSEIRSERRPDSRYAALDNCRYEVSEAEKLMRREGIRWLSSTHKSIEEIATTILQQIRPDRLEY
jgi:regulator of PEP synthase PpsR (kinase-PPPase family)